MRTTRIYKAGLSALLAGIMVTLPLSAVLADSTFYFTDDLSTAYNIDASQSPYIQTANGSIYLVVGALNGTVTSDVINSVTGNISAATLTANATLPIGSYANFYLSNDNGANWIQVQPGVNLMFPNPGSQLRWRALISRSILDLNPYLDSVSVKYTIVGDTAGNNPGSSFAYSGGGFNFPGVADPFALVCSTLNFLGLSCNSTTQVAQTPPTMHPTFNLFGNSSDTASNAAGQTNSDLTGAIAVTGTKDLAGNDINLVRVPGEQTIYELVNGQKHAFPTITIFASYGYTTDMVQTISQVQLDKYPRAKLVKVHGQSQIYYLTEGGLVRPVPNDTVLASYGDRKQDVVEISQKEFNFYPQNQYVFLENPLNRDVFQITAAGKRYLTPMAVQRLGLTTDQVAPINQTELDTYKTLAPVVN